MKKDSYVEKPNVKNIKFNSKLNEEIKYPFEYDKLFIDEYEIKPGSDEIKYLNTEVIERSRAVAGYLLKSIGSNLMKGKSIMNISLPINIFDHRTLLEL